MRYERAYEAGWLLPEPVVDGVLVSDQRLSFCERVDGFLVDSGADQCTLPRDRFDLLVKRRNSHLLRDAVTGIEFLAPLVKLWLQTPLDEHRYPCEFVLGERAILGRPVLLRWRILLDGPANHLSIVVPSVK